MPEQVEVRLPDDVRLHVETSGPADAELTVLLLHGWTLDGRAWHRQLAELRERYGDRVRVVTYDARGHGRSSCMALRTATVEQLGDDLAAVLDAVATDRVVLVGHSLGGMTIMEYAHRHREHFAARVAGLVFVSTTAEGHTHTAYGLSPRITRLIRLAETTGAGVLARCGAWRPPRALLRAIRPSIRWVLFGDRCEPTDIRLVTSAVARASLRSIGGFRASVGTQHRLDTLAELGRLPAAALVGDRDRLTPPPCARSIAAALPTTELTVCPGAGHMLMMERPDEVNSALLGVLGQVLAAGRSRARRAGARRRRAGHAVPSPG
ncbi:alpha/beta fold hydrolase [Micromonospora mirobrigensis]|uniref:Pimeloyl-ACP methyl ester carboxylesterase n=1 Tax=Micromonospora mirobrigensis TaxID=262898 RepID=A0A1C5AGT3_9ACTN|nr:alpha/beta hydrolase [Micromonospora mirobrigensis]SCF44271.1 Pimeloyl-ACP methyl ester carboxylesterase [Micromonospora mirobrigensis]